MFGDKGKLQYEKPDVSVTLFGCEDIITTSDNAPGGGYGGPLGGGSGNDGGWTGS